MSTTNLNIFRNGTFDFEVVGARFTVHKDLVARNSSGLKALMENGMQESRNGSAKLQDTDELTFGRFVEFMYTGDYNAGEPIKVETEASILEHANGGESNEPGSSRSELVPEHEDLVEDSWSLDFGTTKSSKKKGKKLGNRWREEHVEDSHLETPHVHSPPPRFSILDRTINTTAPLTTNSALRPYGDWNLDHLPLFLSHARLYVFADTYDIPNLQNLTAVRLHNALSQFQYSAKSVTNIAELVSYTYERTPDRSNEVDRLRTIVTHFCAVNAGALKASTSFRELLKEGGDFNSDLFCKMCEVYGGFSTYT